MKKMPMVMKPITHKGMKMVEMATEGSRQNMHSNLMRLASLNLVSFSLVISDSSSITSSWQVLFISCFPSESVMVTLRQLLLSARAYSPFWRREYLLVTVSIFQILWFMSWLNLKPTMEVMDVSGSFSCRKQGSTFIEIVRCSLSKGARKILDLRVPGSFIVVMKVAVFSSWFWYDSNCRSSFMQKLRCSESFKMITMLFSSPFKYFSGMPLYLIVKYSRTPIEASVDDRSMEEIRFIIILVKVGTRQMWLISFLPLSQIITWDSGELSGRCKLLFRSRFLALLRVIRQSEVSDIILAARLTRQIGCRELSGELQ